MILNRQNAPLTDLKKANINFVTFYVILAHFSSTLTPLSIPPVFTGQLLDLTPCIYTRTPSDVLSWDLLRLTVSSAHEHVESVRSTHPQCSILRACLDCCSDYLLFLIFSNNPLRLDILVITHTGIHPATLLFVDVQTCQTCCCHCLSCSVSSPYYCELLSTYKSKDSPLDTGTTWDSQGHSKFNILMTSSLLFSIISHSQFKRWRHFGGS